MLVKLTVIDYQVRMTPITCSKFKVTGS